mgnify:CR=1 FL=1
MTDLNTRAQELFQEKEQLIARLHQVDGALIELNKIAQESEETPESETEIPN